MPNAIRYNFRQKFDASARDAFAWCTEYTSGSTDHMLMGDKNAERQVTRVAESTVILTDTFHTDKGDIEKQKLVHFYPDRLSWNAIHMTGPNKYSQFLYEIFPDGENVSHIDFTGLHLDYGHKDLGRAKAKALAEKLCKDDSESWKLLAKALAKDLSK